MQSHGDQVRARGCEEVVPAISEDENEVSRGIPDTPEIVVNLPASAQETG